MKFPERIESAQLVLCRPVSSDALSIFEEYATDPEVTRYLIWLPCAKVDEVILFLKDLQDRWESGSEYSWVITIAGLDQVIGMLTARIGAHGLGVGYVIGKRYWNRGYMSEALSALVESAWDHPDIYRIWAACDVENKASARVMEKCGFKNEGVLRRWVIHPNVSDKPRDSFVFALTR